MEQKKIEVDSYIRQTVGRVLFEPVSVSVGTELHL